MYKKTALLIATFFYSIFVIADTPGKAEMHESKVTIEGINNAPDYVFNWRMHGEDKVSSVMNGASLYLQGSQGAPYSYFLWGVNKNTLKATDTITFSNYYSPDYVILINAVKNDSIYYTQKELSNANKIVNEGNTDSITNKQLVADAMNAKRKHYTKFGLLALSGVVALGGLIWFFVTRRKNKNAAV
jgi:hypothetical protein